MKKIIPTLVLAILFLLKVSAQNEINHTYTLNDGPDKNPMKGWNSGWWDSFDISTVGFQYLKWSAFEPTDGNFDFNAVENVINRPGSAGKHIILRLYTDWFGDNQTSDAGPQWLYSDYGVERLQAPNGKYITNYNHPNYITQVTEAINALATAYDNDPRLYAIELGVLGYWGEWHTFSYNDDNFEIEDTTMNQILNVYSGNFQNKKLMGRYPWREPLASANNIGFHNDFFLPNNNHSNDFDNAIAADNKWLQGPIGGEIPPIDNSEQFMTDLYETTTGMNMINTGHYSTMKVSSNERPCLENPSSQKCIGYMAMHRKMGYNFQIESAVFSENLPQSSNLSVDLNILNIGVAPMYYNWDIQFTLLYNNNLPVSIFETPFDLTTIMPSTSVYTISMSNALENIPEGDYELAVRIIQPEADEIKPEPWQLDARNTYILFSNTLSVIDGSWNASNRLIGAWSILGNVTIDNTTLSTTTLNTNGITSIYPNPVNDRLFITSKNATISSVKIYSVYGQLILNEPRFETFIPVSSLAEGIYFLEAETSKGRVIHRFVKD